MKYPQDKAKELSECKYLDVIARNGCCAMVFMWCLGIDPTNEDAILVINDAIESGVLKKDCTVYWDNFCQFLTGRNCSVDFVNITSIKDIKERTPVMYKCDDNYHWVGVENGKIKFNSIRESNCVLNGKPVEKRVLHIKGISQ